MTRVRVSIRFANNVADGQAAATAKMVHRPQAKWPGTL